MHRLSHSLVTVVALSTVLGAISFDAPRDYRLPSYAVTTGDFNGDGRADVVSGITGIDLSLTNADGTLAAPARLAPASTISKLLAADLNGDARTDIVAADYGAAAVIVLLGNGNGTFQAPAQYPVADQPGTFVRANVTGDANPDLVVASTTVNALTILAGTAGGTFLPAASVPLDGQALALAAGRFNADAVDDLLVTVNTTTPRLYVLLGSGAGTFEPPALVYNGGAYDMTVRDFDGDGDLDFVGAVAGVSLFRGTGAGTFTGPTVLPTGGVGGDVVTKAAVADFNGDLKADIAFGFGCCYGGDREGYVGVLFGDDRGSFVPGPMQPVTPYNGTRDLAAADLDADGRVDLLAVQPGLLRLRRGRGDGTFEEAVAIAGGPPLSIAVADFNQDGRDDYAAAYQGLSTGSCGRFLPSARIEVVLGAGDGTFEAPVTFDSVCYSEFITSGEINGDSYPDLVVVGSDTRVFLGHGDGSFTFASSNIGGERPSAAVVADFSGDGVADLAVANEGTPAQDDRPGSVAVFTGHGDGTFDGPTLLAGVRQARSLVSADFNGDLLPDMAATSTDVNGPSDPYAITVYINTGEGTFQTRFVPVAQPWQPRQLSSADLNGDAIADLVMTAGLDSANYHLAIVLLGNADGTLRFSAAYGIGQGATGALLADFDGNGSADIVVGASLESTILVLSGGGDGTFIPLRNYGVPGFIRGFAAGNFGGDEKADLLAGVNTDLEARTVLLTNVTP